MDELHPIKQETYPALAMNTINAQNIILRFESPTTFKESGFDNPSLEPKSIFRSLLYRWNAFAPEELQIRTEWLDWASTAIRTYRREETTDTKEYGKYLMTGFTGKVEFRLINLRQFRNANAEFDDDSGRMIANVLANYAYYCGTGYRTTLGFGQTKRLEKWMETRFFISYSSKDGDVAERISDSLQKAGYATWLDKKDIVIGQPILDRVGKGIETESDFVLILLSKNSVSSEWCRLELRMAYQKEMSQKRIVVLPIRIDDVDVPVEVQTKKYFQISTLNKSSINSLINEIKSLLKSQGY